MNKKLTAQEIAELSGRALDLAVALKVMGWHGEVMWSEDEEPSDPYLYEPGVEPEMDTDGKETRNNDHIVEWYQVDDENLIAVIRTMIGNGWHFELVQIGAKEATGELHPDTIGQFGGRFDNHKRLGRPAFDKDMAVAVLRAALNAVEDVPLTDREEDTAHA
jgi:hypothetical protein